MRGGGINEVREMFSCSGTVSSHTSDSIPPYLFQFGNVNSMAITLCQSLGQNIGMRWNNARNSAGRKKTRWKLRGTRGHRRNL